MPFNLKRILVGEPLQTHMAHQERIPKWKALSTLSSDALSSVAYATDALLPVLAAFSASAMVWSIPIAFMITGLLLILTLSYRQLIEAYPTGGGSYTVARENLGPYAGLLAAGSLSIDYILTVAVSISAGIENIASAFPFLHEHRVGICLLIVVLIMIMNLRGARESALIFAIPTYFFVLSIFLMLGMGAYRFATGEAIPAAPLLHNVYPAVPAILIFRAFAAGCSALTGVEAISNGVKIFEHPAQRNAKVTLMMMALMLAALFIGITSLAHVYGIVPQEGQTLISQLGHAVYGDSALYYVTQAGTALILLLAANTSYTGFPWLVSLLAKDRYMPRQLASMGDRLVYSNGIIGLSVAAGGLIAIFKAETMRLIPLYAIGVFLSFTLAQAGMMAHHLRKKEAGWRHSLVFNTLGAIATLFVFIDLASTKFFEGAWMVLVVIGILLAIYMKIHKHYLAVGKELSVMGSAAPIKFDRVRHTVVVPVSGVHRGVTEAIRYALSISDDVRACYVDIDAEATQRISQRWEEWYPNVPFVVLKSPYRSVIEPILEYIDDVEQICRDDVLTVVIPEFVTRKRWHQLLHNQTAFFIRAALLFKRGKVVTSVRYHLQHK